MKFNNDLYTSGDQEFSQPGDNDEGNGVQVKMEQQPAYCERKVVAGDEDMVELEDVAAAMDQEEFCNLNQNFIKDGDEDDYKSEPWEDEESLIIPTGEEATAKVKREKSDPAKRRKRKAGSWSKPRYMPKVKKRDIVKDEVSTNSEILKRE